MNERDGLLHAAVYLAFAAKGTDEFPARCQDVIDVHTTWPLVAARRELEQAQADLDQHRAGIDRHRVEALELLHATSHLVPPYPEGGGG